MTIANTFVTLVSTPGSSVGWLDFAEALLVGTGHWVSSKLDNRARLPVVAFSSDGSPLSHLFESLDLCTVVWTGLETEPEHTWALATVLWTLAADEWNVLFILDRGLQSGTLVSHGLPVVTSLRKRGSTLLSKESLEIWVLIKIPLSLVVRESLGAGTESSLLDTHSRIVSLGIEHGVNVLVPGGVALGIFIVEV